MDTHDTNARDRNEEKQMNNRHSRLFFDEDGATALEYGLLAALIAATIVAAVAALGTQIGTIFTNITTSMSAAIAP